jgi:hypothetical protein
MTEKEAIEIIYEGLIGPNSIPVNLRMKEELNYTKLDAVRNATTFLIQFYKKSLLIPKKLALCFIDVYGVFSFKEGFYPEEKLIEYEDIGIELQNLADKLFGE